jgi:Rad3-related DNA helicase
MATNDAGNALPSAVRALVALLAAHADPVSPTDLAREAQARFPTLDTRRIAAMLTQAMAAGAVIERDGALHVPRPVSPAGEGDAASTADRCARVVVIDLESVVRTTDVEPYTDKRIYQVGAIRSGTDTGWVTSTPAFERFLRLPDDTWTIRSPLALARHTADGVAPADALTGLHEFCAGADLVVTYNGTVADMPLLAQAFAREELPALDLAHVDAYYLTLALWPTAATHRLAGLCDEIGVDRTGLGWHDAVDDAKLLDRLLRHSADTVSAWPTELRDLVGSVCPDSPGWNLLLRLGGHDLAPAPVRQPDVAAILDARVTARTPRRLPGPPAGRQVVRVERSLRDAAGRVNPGLLAHVARGADARTRPAQEQMSASMHQWADQGVPALVEAPTGTGKSYAVLACALDWLAGGNDRTAIITTFTKLLQSQLADDVVTLDERLPGLGLLAATDVVKGTSGRLSLRALTAALADATAISGVRPTGERNRFLARPGFRELLVFLTLRFLASGDIESGWTARSVDQVDVPAFFTDYLGAVTSLWLESLSQASNGEYTAGTATSLAEHTDTVTEALTSHRLLLANHALLLAHLDDLSDLGPDTLLIVDEAHQMEDAATSALSTVLDYRAVTNLHADLDVWARRARPGLSRDGVQSAVRNLGMLLDHEQFPRAAAQVFDARGAGAGSMIGSRAVTLASDYAGTAGVGQVRTLAGLTMRLSGQCKALTGAMRAYLAQNRAAMDFFEAERVQSLLTATGQIAASAESIVADVTDIVGRAQAQPAPEAVPDLDDTEDDPALAAQAEPPTVADDLEDDSDIVVASEVRLDAGEARLGDLPPGASNRVVYAEELEQLRGDLRYYKFALSSSPIELGEDPDWRQFLGTFARTYYVSATLRVAGRWDFIRTRLGLPATIATLALDTPFDLSAQAELVCLSDFPSWAEQSEGAMRTVAHQLAGYAQHAVSAVPADDPDGRGGFDGGAMVLTTARSTAGGIAEHLATELRRRGNDTPVLSALVLGNRRGVAEFTDTEHGGGFLVGTRGLWQGVDVADDQRLRMVWINKLPFAPFAAPVIEARRAVVTERALAAHAEDPDAAATELYYLPLAALQLRQAVGRLIRSERHRGIVVISDRKLAGATALRRSYRNVFLGSLDAGLLRTDQDTGEVGGANVVTMAEGWERIWTFLGREGLIDPGAVAGLCTPAALEEHTLLPHTRKIRQLAMTRAQVQTHRAAGTLQDEVLARAAQIGGLLALSDEPATLKDSQKEVIAAVAAGANVLGLLPTGFGKSFCFQLPALVLPGVTLVVSPLVALMTDQAMSLNRSIGGAVRALVAPLRESSSRAGKTEVADQLLGRADHGIRLVYVSPERLTQRRFRELVRDGVKTGIITRIALDEAHTFVQWDDFRPSMGRVEMFLKELRDDHGLAVTALTATANRTVQAGLREGVFSLPGDTTVAGEVIEAAAGQLLTVRENPIRPELAIFRRSIATAGPMVSGGLAEEVASAVADHAIFYCLTVKEVVALAAHLKDFLGDGAVRVRRFHGRLTEAEKSAVLTEFRETPRRGEEGFAPLIVVATSAFGLGIDRPDVRTVFCASAPTDVAALYQQVGRAGRDAAGKPAPAESDDAPTNVGMALLTSRGLRTVQFMTGSDLPGQLLTRMGRAVLASGTVLKASRVADTLMGEDITSGALSLEDAAKSRTSEQYTAGVVRAFATLAALGAVDDLGDFPPHVTVKAGELLGVQPTDAAPGSSGPALESRVVAAVLALPVRTNDGLLQRARLYVPGLDRHLTSTVGGYRGLAEDAAATWQMLADLHDRGVLDVSAAPSRRLVTGIAVNTRTMPAGFVAAVTGKAARAAVEIALLRDFFDDNTACANRKLADYFGVADLPDGCCSHAGNRCSACWASGNWPAGQIKPKVADALETPKPRAAGTRTDAGFAQRRLDAKVYALIWDVYAGVHILDLYRSLRGEDSYYSPRTKKRHRIRTALVNSRYFGSSPSIKLPTLEDSLARLEADNKVVLAGAVWRDTGHVARDVVKAAQAAAAAQQAGVS